MNEIITITPAIAKKYLEKNISNRPLSKPWIETLKKRILDGEWVLNGESIKFDTNGNLIDGQHRLNAVMQTKRYIVSYVMYDLPSESFHTIDIGKKRSAGDILSLSGVKHANIFGAAVKMIYFYEKYGAPCAKKGSLISNSKMLELVKSYPELPYAVAKANKIKRSNSKIGLTASSSAFCYYFFSKSNQEKVDLFFKKINYGYDIKKNCPAGLLRNALINESKMRTRGYNTQYWLHLTVKAWNKFVKDGSYHKLHILFSKDEHLKFPKIL